MDPLKTETTPPAEAKKPKRLLVRGPYDGNLKVNEFLAVVDIATIIKDHEKDGLKVTQRRIGEALGYSPSSMTNLLKRLDKRFKCRVTDHREGSRQLRLTEKGEEIYAVWQLSQPYLAHYYDIRAIEMIPLIEKVAQYFNGLIAEAMDRDEDAELASRNDLARLRRGRKPGLGNAGPNAEERLDMRIANTKMALAAKAEQRTKAKATTKRNPVA